MLVLQFTAKKNGSETHVVLVHWAFSDAGSTPAASTTLISMSLRLQLEYWKDGSWFVGRLPQVPGVFSQGETLDALEENIRDAYRLMAEMAVAGTVALKEIEVSV